MQSYANSLFASARKKVKSQRAHFYRFLIFSLLAPLFVVVVPAAPKADAGVTSITAPSDVIVSTTGTTINVAWGAPVVGASLITAYQVDYSTDGSTWTTASSSISPGVSTYAVTSLSSGTSYYIRVSAKYSGGNSPYAYPWTKLYGTTTPIKSSNNVVYEPGFGLASYNNQAANVYASASFTRVKYKMQYMSNSGTTFNYASADFTKWNAVNGNAYDNGGTYNSPAATIASLAIPDAATTNVIQVPVSDMTVESSNSSLNDNGLSGRLELWANDYGPGKGAVGVSDGSATTFDQNDRPNSTAPNGYGSFQVHDITNTRTVMAWNAQNSSLPGIGFGNSPTVCNATASTDWTYCGAYSSSTDYYYNATNRSNWKLEVFINVPIKVGTNGLLMRYDSKQYASYPGSGSTWTDLSPNAVNATLNNSLTTSTVSNGTFNMSAMTFNGTNQYANISGNFGYDFSAGFSASFYANMGNASNWERIIDIGNGDANRNILIAREGTTQNLFFEIYNSGPAGASSGYCKAVSAIDNNTWTHWAVVLNGSTCIFYKNGAIWSGTTTSYVGGTTTNVVGTAVAYAPLPSTTNRANLYIGRSNWVADSYFEGGIADIALYNKAISRADVLAMVDDQKATTVYSNAATGECATRVANPSNVTVTSVTGDCVVKFSAPSNVTTSNKWFTPSNVSAARVLVVAGGGGGGAHVGGGGGAGGMIDTTTSISPSSALSISTGAGGAGAYRVGAGTSYVGVAGANSSFGSNFVALGGGPGASWDVAVTRTGGSGGGGSGGGSSYVAGGATLDSTQGNAGGSGNATCNYVYSYPTAGGGGAGAPGQDGYCISGVIAHGGEGGIGKQSDITGTATYYAGGGGGGGHNDGTYAVIQAKGGLGGGGNAAVWSSGIKAPGSCVSASVTADNGTDGLGGGGGGAGIPSSSTCNNYAGRGGSGIVIVRYGTSTLTFNSNNGSGYSGVSSIQSSTYSYVTLPGQSGLTRSGFTFAGWNTAVNGKGTNFAAGAYIQLSGSRTLYAQWNSTISYNSNGGTETRSAASTLSTSSEASTTLSNGLTSQGTIVTSGIQLNLDASQSSSYSGSGSTWNDISGNSKNATLVGSPTWDASTGSFILNGTNQYIDLGNNFAYMGTTPFSLGITFKTDDAMKTQSLMSRHDAGVVGYYYMIMNTGQYQVTREVSPWGHFSNAYVKANDINYATMTYDGSVIRFYINGVLDSQSNSGSHTQSVATKLLIGAKLSSGSPIYFFNGRIYNAQVYSKALSLSEVQQNYNALVPNRLISKTGSTLTGWSSTTDSSSAVLNAGFDTNLPTPYIRLEAKNFNDSTKVWTPTNYSGLGINYTSNKPTLNTNQTGWGASASFSTVSGLGANAVAINLNNPELTTYTFCGLARYKTNGASAPATTGRIFTGTYTNWLSGWYAGETKGTYHSAGFVYRGTATSDFSWHLVCDSGNNIYWDGVQITPTSYQSYTALPSLSIGGNYRGAEYSDFEVAEVVIYDQNLSQDQIDAVQRYFKNTYGLINVVAGTPDQSMKPSTNYSSPGNTTLYATWGSTITYDANKASTGVAPDTQVFTRGSGTLATNSGNLAKVGYSFYGWNTSADGNGTFYAAGSSYSGSDITLYAMYKAPVKFQGTLSGGDPVILSPYMRYKATDYDATKKIWYDSSGNNRDTAYVSGTPSKITTTGNGSSKNITVLSGSSTDVIKFKNAELANWTLFQVARYSGSTKGRMLVQENNNFLFGFYNTHSGVAHYESWVTSDVDAFGSNFFISTGAKSTYRANGSTSLMSASPGGNVPLYANLAINSQFSCCSTYTGTQPSDFQIAELIIFDRTLSLPEIQQVEDYLGTTYGISAYTNQKQYVSNPALTTAVGVAANSDTLTAINGYNNVFTISPTIAGITLNTSGNSVSIKIASTLAIGTYNETLTVTDSNGNTATLPLSISVVPPLQWSNSNLTSVTTTHGKRTPIRLDLSGGYGTRVYTVTNMSTPAPTGITIDTSTTNSDYVTLWTDTGTAAGTYSESITVVDGTNVRRTFLLTITINSPPDISYTAQTDSTYPILASDLFIHWDFSKTTSYARSGTSVTDLSGNGISGTFTAATNFTEAAGGSVAVSPSIVLRNTNSFTGFSNSQSFSKFMWVYPTSGGILVDVCDNSSCSAYHESELEITSTSISARAWNQTSTSVTTSNLLNAWHYIGYSWSASGGISIYLDGVMIKNLAASGSRGAPSPQYELLGNSDGTNIGSATGATFRLGAYQVYKAALTNAQVQANYQNTKVRFFSATSAAPTYSGNATLAVTAGTAAEFSVFTLADGTGNKTVTLSGANATITVETVTATTSKLKVSSSISATNATTSKSYYETMTAVDEKGIATAYYFTINVAPKIAITATTDTITTTYGIAAYDTITTTTGTGSGNITFIRTSSSNSSAITNTSVVANPASAVLTVGSTLPAGTYYETFTATDAAGATALKVIQIVVNPPLSLTGPANNRVETTYTRATTANISVAYGTGTRTATISPTISGITITTTNIAAGTIVLNLSNAVAAGTYLETITVTDSLSASAKIVMTVVVNAAPLISYNGATSGALTFVTTAGGSVTTGAFTATLGTSPRRLTLSGLNSGISIDTSTADTGLVTFGSTLTSTNTTTAKSYYETVTVSDSFSVTATRALTVIVNPAIIETATSTSITTTSGIETTTAIYATQGSSNKTFALTDTSGGGVTLTSGVNQATLKVLSTANPGTYSITVTASDTAGATTALVITVIVTPPPTILGSGRLETTKGVLFKSPLYSISGGTGTLTMSVTNSPTNASISLTNVTSSGANLQVGTASETGTYTSTIRVTDVRGAYSEIAVTVIVNGPVSLSGSMSITKTYGNSSVNGYSTNGTGTAPFSFAGSTVCAVVKTVSGSYTYERINGTDACTWTAPVGVTTVDAFMVGAGGGGGPDGGAGGGGGSINTLSSLTLPANRQLAVQVGAGGTGGIWAGDNATAGGTTSITSGATTYTAPGGAAGGGCGSAASAGGVTGSGGTPVAGGNGGYGATGSACSAGGTGNAGSVGPSSSFTGSSVTYGGGGGGGPYPNSISAIGLNAGGSGGGGTSAQSKGQGSYGLPIYFRTQASTPNNAVTSKDAFTTGTCGALTGNISFATDSEFPCSQKDNFQGYATGYFVAPYTGDITFYLTSDDSSDLVINVNGTNKELQLSTCCTTVSATWSGFVAGQSYPINVYFTEITGVASWKLEYSYTGVSQTIIPVSQFRSGSYGLATYFKANSTTIATSKTVLNSGTCAQQIININFTSDSSFPCDGKDNFQGYATGYFVAPYTGSITFTISSDDSSDLVINVNGTDRELALTIGTTSATWSGFVKGQYYPISVYFTELTGSASWKLEYEYTGQSKIVIPTDYLRSTNDFVAPTAGTNGLGGGGGAGAAGLFKISGAQGGSGLAIIKYLTQSDSATDAMITATVNQESPSGLLTLSVPAYVTAGTYTEVIKVQDAANSAPYSATITITVNKATPTAKLALPGSVTTAKYGTAVSISATASTPGNVTFKKGGSTISGCSSVATTSGIANCLWTPSAVETASITAILTPTDSTNYNNSNETASALSVLVGQADTLTITANSPSAITYSPSMTMPANGYTTSGLASIDTIASVTYSYAGQGNTCATGGTCAVGDTGPAGGKIIYVSATTIDVAAGISSGGIYLEAAPAPYSTTTYNWCEGIANPYTTTLNASGTAIGTGANNTRIITTSCTGGAAYVAANLSLGGYSDWFLPSNEELLLMSNLRATIGLVGTALYWSSSESSNWVAGSLVMANGGGPIGGQNKGQATPLWPIRAFSPGAAISGSPTNAGTYSIVPSGVTFSGSGSVNNYRSVQYTNGTLTINRASRGASWSIQYNGNNTITYAPARTETVTVNPAFSGDGSAAYSTSSSVCSVNASTGQMSVLGVGSCGIQVVIPQTVNYLSDTKTVTFAIARGPRTSTITPALSTIKYGDTTTVTTSITLSADSATVTYSAGTSSGCQIDPATGLVTGVAALGTCTVRVTYDQTDLYESSTATANITVNKALAPVVTTDSITALSYTGSRFVLSPTYKVTGILARDISKILPGADVSSSASIAAISASTYTSVTSFNYKGSATVYGVFWSYDSSTVPYEAGTYAVTGVGLGLLGGLSMSNYETPTYVASNFVINKASQLPLVINLSYMDSITVPYDVSVSGGSSTGALTLAVLPGGTAQGCVVDAPTSNMRLKSSSAGTCNIQVTKAPDRNYLVVVSDSQTVNILNFVVSIIELFDNPTGISINHDVPIEKGPDACTVDCVPTITAIQDASGNAITAIQIGIPFRIVGTNFNTTTTVYFKRSTPADSIQVDSDTQLTVMPPSALAVGDGVVNIVVVANGGRSFPNSSVIKVNP